MNTIKIFSLLPLYASACTQNLGLNNSELGLLESLVYLQSRRVETLQKRGVPVSGCRRSLWWKGSAVHTYRPGLQTWFSFFSLLLATTSPVGFFFFTVELTMTVHSGLVLRKWFLTWWDKPPLYGQKALKMQKMLSWNKYWNDLWQN